MFERESFVSGPNGKPTVLTSLANTTRAKTAMNDGQMAAPTGHVDADVDGISYPPPSSKPGGRRAIFNHTKKATDVKGQPSTYSEVAVDIRCYAPPQEQKLLLRRRFSMVDEVPLDDIQRKQELPPVPSPLLRHVCDGSATPGGAYPLVQPKSILREGKYSSPVVSKHSLHSPKSEDVGMRSKQSSKQALDWTRTSSFSSNQPGRLLEFTQLARGMNLEETKDFFRASEFQEADQGHVKFDPRVVITEFPDGHKRDWFGEDELNRFRQQTTRFAQRYLILHPEAMEEFNRPTIDPVTGRPRNKALFAMPGLSSSSLTCNEDPEELLKNTVRAVLIVDPNKAIIDLFRKSIQQMFPTTMITGAQSGDEALRICSGEIGRRQWDGSSRGFDIIIVDERLSRHGVKSRASFFGRPRGYVNLSLRNDSGSFAQVTSASQLKSLPLQETRKPKFDSLSNLEGLSDSAHGAEDRTISSGSQLIQRICQLEAQCLGAPKNKSDAATDVPVALLPRRPLIIGVSVDVEHDRKALTNSGADLVWPKPPPRMDSTLRNQLISALINKRQPAASSSSRRPSFEDREITR